MGIVKTLTSIALVSALMLMPHGVSAQTQLPASPFSALFMSSRTVNIDSYKETTVSVKTFTRIVYTATASDWVTATVADDGTLEISVTANLSDGQRTATIDLRDGNNHTSQLTVVQPGYKLGAIATDPRNYVTPISAFASSAQSGSGIQLTYDDNLSTIYHSSWSGFNPSDESTWPSLTYNFVGIDDFTNIYYYPRQSGTNGNFKEFELRMKRRGDSDYTSVGVYNFAGSSNLSVIVVPEEWRNGVNSVQFVIHSGSGNFASCAEMKFEGIAVEPVYNTPGSATASSVQTGYGIENSYDGNTSTYYHSAWSGFDPSDESAWPVLEYFFDTPIASLDMINYIPRSTTGNGDSNGAFGEFELLVKHSGESDYTSVGIYDFGKVQTPSSIYVPSTFGSDVAAVKFIVHSSATTQSGKNFANCVEMQFITPGASTGSTAKTWDEEVAATFSDSMLTSLKDGITDEEIEAIENPFLKQLAQLMKSGEYTSEGKISTHKALKNYTTLADEWSTPGKYYSQIDGVTGVMLSKGTYAVMVEGLDATKTSITLRCIGWTVEDLGSFKNFYKSETFNLVNGLNIINKTSDWDGLAYVCNYNDAGIAEDTPPEVKVHIIAGKVNGVITADKTNDENQQILDNACYTTIDCLGDRVQSIWEVEALKTYAKGQYVRYVNVLDILIAWEHRLLGFEKYDMLPANHTLAYVNYDYYMYQGGMGVTFKYDTQYRVCSPDKIMYSDDDVVWGLSHEWGHQHQMHPYFCWGGLGETSNNMNSCYNVLHMGYAGTRVLNAWAAGRKDFITETGTYPGTFSSARHNASVAAASGAFDWSTKIKEFVLAQDSTITNASVNKLKAIGNNEVGVEETLAPFFMLHCYFSEPQDDRLAEDYHEDFTPDLYQSLRQTAKTTDPDKYELLARAQEGVSGAYEAFVEKYPESVWTVNGYITASSNRYQNTLPFILNYMVKASRLSGYNLYPFFEKWGFFRNIAILIGDYGNYYYVMMEDMFDEIKDDMDALNLKTMDDALVTKISNADVPQFVTPSIPNDCKLTTDDLQSTRKTTSNN